MSASVRELQAQDEVFAGLDADQLPGLLPSRGHHGGRRVHKRIWPTV